MRNPLPIPFTTVDYLIRLRPPNTVTSSYLQLSTTSSDCVLLNTDTSSYLQPSITSSDCVLFQAADVGILGTFTFASIIPSCFFTLASVIPTLFSFLLNFFTLLVPVIVPVFPTCTSNGSEQKGSLSSCRYNFNYIIM